MYEHQYAIGQRVRVYPGSRSECYGVIVEDFGETAGYAVTVGETHIADPSRRWAVTLDDKTLVFADAPDLASLSDRI